MADELLSCPFCGGAAEVREWDFPYVRFQARCVECKTTGRTRFNERAKAIAAWNHRTPPTPATEEREAVARAICAAGYHPDDAEISWKHCADCGETDRMYRKADAALLALAPIRAQEIAAARAEEQGYRHTQVAALKQVHAAEILAAEARGYAMAVEDAANEAMNLWEYGIPAQEFPRRIRAIEHGSGK